MRGPFNVNAPAIAAGAAAIADTAHVERARQHNDVWLPWLTAEIRKLGLDVTDSVGNFLLVSFPAEQSNGAAAADAFFQSRGIIVRGVGGYGLPNALRITVGTEAENKAVVAALTEFRAGARA